MAVVVVFILLLLGDGVVLPVDATARSLEKARTNATDEYEYGYEYERR